MQIFNQFKLGLILFTVSNINTKIEGYQRRYFFRRNELTWWPM